MERAELVAVEAVRRSQRVEPRAPECLVGVDVAEARERPLIEERRLQRGAAVREPGGERCRAEAARERLLPEPRREVVVQLGRFDEEPRAEAPDVAVRDVRSVV